MEAKAEAEAASLAKSRFLANMSYELRTPLNAILGFSEMMEQGTAGPLDARQQEYVGYIRQSGAHLLDIINEISTWQRSMPASSISSKTRGSKCASSSMLASPWSKSARPPEC